MNALLTLLWRYLKPYRKWALLSLITAPLMAAIRAAPVPLVKTLMDDVFSSKDPAKLAHFPLLIIGSYLLNFIIRFTHYFSMRYATARVNQDLKTDLFQHTMGLSADFFSSQKSGELSSRIGSDPNWIDHGISQITVLFREPIQLLLLFGWCIHINWRLTLVTVLIFPPMAWIFYFSNKSIKRYITRMQEEQGRLFSTLQEAFGGFRMIQAFQLEKYTLRKYENQGKNYRTQLIKTSLLEELASPSVEMLSAIAASVVLYAGGRQVLKGALTEGELFSFFTAFGLMTQPLRVLNDANVRLATAAAACTRIMHAFAWRSSIVEPENPVEVRELHDNIVFNKVSFSYPDAPERKILNNVSLSVSKGKNIALVGESGAGKSSLVNLLPRLFDVTAGVITIDGVPVRNISTKSLRGLISVVSQDIFLFNDTVEENIRCGKMDATTEEVHQAAALAHAKEFIERLPHGYMTVIGDRGQKLSGGERQRLSIARAFLRQSPILILDEATSALDNQSEKWVQEALDTLKKDRTCITIAHRLTTIQGASQIYVLQKGNLIEQGTHVELLEKGGLYQKFWNLAQKQNP